MTRTCSTQPHKSYMHISVIMHNVHFWRAVIHMSEMSLFWGELRRTRHPTRDTDCYNIQLPIDNRHPNTSCKLTVYIGDRQTAILNFVATKRVDSAAYWCVQTDECMNQARYVNILQNSTRTKIVTQPNMPRMGLNPLERGRQTRSTSPLPSDDQSAKTLRRASIVSESSGTTGDPTSWSAHQLQQRQL